MAEEIQKDENAAEVETVAVETEVAGAKEPVEEKGIIENAIKSIKESLNLRHYGTFDFLIHPKRGVYLLEVNTQPSLHEESTLFKSLGSVGVKAHEFLGHILKLAMRRK